MTVISTQDFEKLGTFYLGREVGVDPAAAADPNARLLLYDARDLVTHGVCVGMTGSGKTGLCICLLEEAAIDGIPAIVIDPKGDLANLLLAFPDLKPADFRPWINTDDARRKGMSPDEFAADQAGKWRKGLESWGQDAARIQRLKDAADFAIYTPGSSAGLQLSILRSFDAPEPAVLGDADLYRSRLTGTVSSLLGLLGIEGDPVTSREHILLSALIDDAWRKGQSLDVGELVRRVQKPTIARVGVMEIETFYAEKDRFALAMKLNGLIASPTFAAWAEGEPLDVGALLHNTEGKPRISICNIAHLGDAERMFFVATLLQRVLEWTRQQSGTTSLRAIIYMDEIAGYCPPSASPPSKLPLLTLMKQARAFGVGVLLATQNPVDLDYKGLSNAGTWMIGRLQTERDKMRLLDGLESASGGAMDRAAIDKLLSGLRQRVFLLNNVHDDGPVLFETRWAMSYLRGPIARDQIAGLMGPRKASIAATPVAREAAPPIPVAATQSARAAAVAGASVAEQSSSASAPVLPASIRQLYAPVRSQRPADARAALKPWVVGSVSVGYADAKLGVDMVRRSVLLVPLLSGPVPVDFDHASEALLSEDELQTEAPMVEAQYEPIPPGVVDARAASAWKRGVQEAVFRAHRLTLLSSPSLGLVSRADELEAAFRIRLAQASREAKDKLADELRDRYGPKIKALAERLRKAEQAVEVQRAQAKDARISAAIGFGGAILGAVLGRKKVSTGVVGKAGTAVRGASRSARESGDVKRAEDNADAIRQQITDLEAEFKAELERASGAIAPPNEQLERIELRPKKTAIEVRLACLLWAPIWRLPDGSAIDAWR